MHVKPVVVESVWIPKFMNIIGNQGLQGQDCESFILKAECPVCQVALDISFVAKEAILKHLLSKELSNDPNEFYREYGLAKTVALKCGHILCTECWDAHSKVCLNKALGATCPLCRKSMVCGNRKCEMFIKQAVVEPIEWPLHDGSFQPVRGFLRNVPLTDSELGGKAENRCEKCLIGHVKRLTREAIGRQCPPCFARIDGVIYPDDHEQYRKEYLEMHLRESWEKIAEMIFSQPLRFIRGQNRAEELSQACAVAKAEFLAAIFNHKLKLIKDFIWSFCEHKQISRSAPGNPLPPPAPVLLFQIIVHHVEEFFWEILDKMRPHWFSRDLSHFGGTNRGVLVPFVDGVGDADSHYGPIGSRMTLEELLDRPDLDEDTRRESVGLSFLPDGFLVWDRGVMQEDDEEDGGVGDLGRSMYHGGDEGEESDDDVMD
ncbi:uncharacterized protein BCR38DRAFT_528517 [Pseudomassariella vexata]|uniref:RING-type domain-containing protein n=1 Tax=Pseudomassariella vexata TaxID=1141098 RepID=A0A1Y2DAV5_9PEZI|nr:uncharacterized protein BCR38DRAFT_528517 [Pseudomassariella vexata]ORY56327.1 hypothetical protein BCR38DRAFT_528517 [Pseudomassariella vexata]